MKVDSDIPGNFEGDTGAECKTINLLLKNAD